MRRWLCGHGLHAWETWVGIQGGSIVTKRRCVRRGCKTIQETTWP